MPDDPVFFAPRNDDQPSTAPAPATDAGGDDFQSTLGSWWAGLTGRGKLISVVVVVMLAMAAIGSLMPSETPAPNPAPQHARTAPTAAKCVSASKGMISALKNSLTVEGRGQLLRVRYVKLHNTPAGGYRGTFYVVAGTLIAAGIEDGTTMAWAVNKDFVKTNGGVGLVLGLDEMTRGFSDFGSAMKFGSRDWEWRQAIDDTPESDAARSCTEQTR
jgi:hypothetical protein